MLYTEATVRDNLRTREGRRVFILGKADMLTPGARDYLAQQHIEILPAEATVIEEYALLGGGFLREKPEDMTHLQGNILVRKDHPRILFRGKLDSLQGELLMCQLELPQFRQELGQLLELTRQMMRCDVLEETLEMSKLCGLTAQQLRDHSHRPQEYYGQPHFMPQWSDGAVVLRLNQLRCAVRETETAAVAAFQEGKRADFLQAMNRMSSMVYLLMIRAKKEI